MKEHLFSVSVKLAVGTFREVSVLAEGFVHAAAIAFPTQTVDEVASMRIERIERSNVDYDIKLAEARSNAGSKRRVG